jgi:hypothetical protein
MHLRLPLRPMLYQHASNRSHCRHPEWRFLVADIDAGVGLSSSTPLRLFPVFVRTVLDLIHYFVIAFSEIRP